MDDEVTKTEVARLFSDGESMCAVGKTLLRRNDPHCFFWLRKAASLGCGASFIWMAWCLAKGIGCDTNIEQSREWFDKAIAVNEFSDFPVTKEDTLINLIYESGSRECSLLEDHYCLILDYLKHAVSRGSEAAMEMIFGWYQLSGKYDEFFDLLYQLGLNNEHAVHYIKAIRDKISEDRLARLPPFEARGQQLLCGFEDTKTCWHK